MKIVDDGRGFEPDSASKGQGLPNMRERVGKLGGTLTVVSAPKKGTELVVTLAVDTKGATA
jgi:signal transduction histidine kinase